MVFVKALICAHCGLWLVDWLMERREAAMLIHCRGAQLIRARPQMKRREQTLEGLRHGTAEETGGRADANAKARMGQMARSSGWWCTGRDDRKSVWSPQCRYVLFSAWECLCECLGLVSGRTLRLIDRAYYILESGIIISVGGLAFIKLNLQTYNLQMLKVSERKKKLDARFT